MSSITKLRTSETIQYFDHSAALALVQAFHRHLDLTRLLGMFWSQSAALVQATSLRYCCPEQAVDTHFGSDGRHTARYNLSYQNQALGEMTFSFQRRVDQDTLATAEDLIALVMPAIKNALAYLAACRAAELARGQRVDEPSALQTGGDDTVVLLAIDGFAEIGRSHGAAWAQTLMESVQKQLREGLREADSVFQIDDAVLAVLLPQTTREAALDVAAKIRILVAGLHLREGNISRQLTASMGIAGTRHAANAESVLEQARAALADAQRAGSNSVRVFTESQTR